MDVSLALRCLLIKAKAGVIWGKPIIIHELKQCINLNERVNLGNRASAATRVHDNRRLICAETVLTRQDKTTLEYGIFI